MLPSRVTCGLRVPLLMFLICKHTMQKATFHEIAVCLVLFIWNGLENGHSTGLLWYIMVMLQLFVVF